MTPEETTTAETTEPTDLAPAETAPASEPSPEPTSETADNADAPTPEDEERYAHMAAQADVPESPDREKRAADALDVFMGAVCTFHPHELRSLLSTLAPGDRRRLQAALSANRSDFNW